MRLTLQTDFALRVLLYLAGRPDELSTVKEIASAYKVSHNHLVKVAHRLVQLGYVEGVRGHSGGIRLGREPSAILVGDVVRRMEPDFDLVECFDRTANSCAITGECSLRGPLHEAQRAFFSALDRYTLADLISVPGMRRQLVRLRA